MHIGVLQAGHLAEDLEKKHGTYGDIFRAFLAPHGLTTTTWSVVDGEFPDSVEAAEGWLITGSKHGAYDPLPWIAPLEDFVRQSVAADRPMVGVCFGHQVMAQALGGRVEKFAGGWTVGPTDYAFADGPRTVQAWHQDQVIEAPAGAQTVASNASCAHAALLYPGKAYTVQPHPEFDDALIEGLLEHRGPGVVPEDRLDAARARMGRPLDRARLAGEFARFFRERQLA